jgi:hypothetical protein
MTKFAKTSIVVALIGLMGSASFAEYLLWTKDSGTIHKHQETAFVITDTSVAGSNWKMDGMNWPNIGIGTSAAYTTNNVNTNELNDVVIIDVMAQMAAKTNMLNSVTGLYKTFLTNEWTTCLRTYGIVSNSVTINWTNTDTTANMGYLMTLRAMDSVANKPTYSYYKGEFESFRINIERLGGSMADIK